jgi:PAS domain S-box-containing protein
LAVEDLQLFERLEAGIVVTDGAGIVVRWNAHARRLLGLSAKAAVGQPLTELLSVMSGADIAGPEVRAAAKQPGGWHGLTQLRLAAAGDVWVRAHVQVIRLSPTDDRPAQVALLWPDPGPIAEGGAGGPAQLPYSDLLRRSPEALFLIGLDAGIVDASDAGAALFQTMRAEIIGKSIASYIPGLTPASLDGARKELLRAGSILREAVIKRPTGESNSVELIITLASPIKAGLALVRIRDLTEVRQFDAVLRSLDDLATMARTTWEMDAVVDRAIEIATAVCHTDIAMVAVTSSGAIRYAAGSAVSKSACAHLAAVASGEPRSPGQLPEIDGPLQIDLAQDSVEPALAEHLRAYGCRNLRATPLWFGDRQVGGLFLFWIGPAPEDHDFHQLEIVGRLVGIAIGNVELRNERLQEARRRTSLEVPARLGAIVVNQMTDGILTTDAQRNVTAVNPAAERLYGFRAEDAVGRPIDEVLQQTALDGNSIGQEWIDSIRAAGDWQGRVVHRPLIGPFAGRNIVVDLSITILHDESQRPAGAVGLSREVAASSRLDSDGVALAAVAVAASRSRTRQEVANAVLERLCEVTMADFAVIGTWGGEANQQIEASRGLSEEVLQIIGMLVMPELSSALDQAIPIVSIEKIGEWLAGTDAGATIVRSGITTGFLVSLRVRDDAIGFLGLGSRRATWTRPRDEVVLQMASQVGNALENARLMERLEYGLSQERRLTAQLETLMGLTLLPHGDISEETIAQVLLDRIVVALGADGGFVVRESGGRFKVVASRNLAAQMREMAELLAPDAFQFWRRLESVENGGAFYDDFAVDANAEFGPRMMSVAGVSAQAVFPVREGERLTGAFLCFFSGSDERRAHVDDRNVEAVGRIISIAYANVRLSEGLAKAAEHERRLTAELRALQELTLLGASTDDMNRLAEETIEAVVLATGATGGGYILIDALSARVTPMAWVGPPSPSWPDTDEMPQTPSDWPPFAQLQPDDGIWLSQSDADSDADSDAESDAESDARVTRRVQAVLPLRVDDKLAGALHLEWSETPRSEQYNIRFFEPISRICSISLANFGLRSELLHRAAAERALGHRLDTLDELTRIGEEASSFEELAHRTVSLVREALGAAGVCYLLIEPGHHFETRAVAGETGAFRQWLKGVPAKDVPGGSLLLSGGGSILGEFVASQVNERVLPIARATGFRSFGAIPIRTGEELAGALLCFFEQPAATLPLDESALDSVARIAGIALANYRLRERLVSSEERYRTLFEETPDALLVSALDGTVLDANEAAVRLYRVNRGEVLGRYVGQLIAADEREMARRRQIVWAQGGGTFRDRGRRPDGTEFPVQIEIRVVELGGQRRFLHLVRDLSDQESLQRELLQAQKMEAIGQLVSGVAHELNNPLAAIIAFSQLIRSDDRLPEDMKHDAGLLVQEADRTRRIVQNLLDFARARPPERRTTNIAVLVNSVLELQSYALNSNQVVVKVEIPASLPEVDLDRAQLQQVLLNLTINAIQAMRGRDRSTPAHLWVSAALVKTGSSSGMTHAEKQLDDPARVRISIRDDGPGVQESVRARLFDPFFTTKQPGEGTGLGLSVSFGIVAAHDGHLWYEPGPAGVGSTFIIELPVTARPADDQQMAGSDGAVARRSPQRARPQPKEPGVGMTKRSPASRPASPQTAGPAVPASAAAALNAAAAAPTSEPEPAAGPAPTTAAPATPLPSPETAPAAPRPCVLALDDEPSIRAFLRKALNAAGMECSPFQDGADALDGVRDNHFDVMLIDHRMAGMSGTEFYEAAVDLRPELTRRAVFMSGDVLNPDLRGFATQRGIRLLAKPFDIDAVIRVVREVLAAADEAEGASAQ